MILMWGLVSMKICGQHGSFLCGVPLRIKLLWGGSTPYAAAFFCPLPPCPQRSPSELNKIFFSVFARAQCLSSEWKTHLPPSNFFKLWQLPSYLILLSRQGKVVCCSWYPFRGPPHFGAEVYSTSWRKTFANSFISSSAFGKMVHYPFT